MAVSRSHLEFACSSASGSLGASGAWLAWLGISQQATRGRVVWVDFTTRQFFWGGAGAQSEAMYLFSINQRR